MIAAGGDRAGREDPGSAPPRPSDEAPAVPAWWSRLSGSVDGIIPLLPAGQPTPRASATGSPSLPKSGILNVDKPADWTSHDVVAAIRRASGERRVGHAGTLDPMATGVLVVCLGSATRVIEEIQAQPKRYVARVHLGVRTKSGDAQGEVIATCDPSGITRAAVDAALDRFRGDILQTPPMVSALKHQGRRLYALARQGVEVERAPRPVSVHALEVTDWVLPELTLDLTVSKGTYIRTIADDLGEALGVGAHLTALRRTAVGPFTIETAEQLPRIVEGFAEGWWPSLVHPLDTALLGYAAMVVDAPSEAALRQGRQIGGAAPGPDTTRLVRAYSVDGLFIGLMTWDVTSGQWQPDRIFPRPS